MIFARCYLHVSLDVGHQSFFVFVSNLNAHALIDEVVVFESRQVLRLLLVTSLALHRRTLHETQHVRHNDVTVYLRIK